MAPSAITEDYYKVLELSQTAAPGLIRKSYLRLAIRLHPDRQGSASTQAFQRLQQAYETLSDESRRREYDLLHPSITKDRPGHPSTQTSPQTDWTASSDTARESAQIAALRKAREERTTQWRQKRVTLESSLFQLRRNITRLQNSVGSLTSIAAAEASEEARKKGWGAWFVSQIYGQVEESEEEVARKDRLRQERRIEKDLKERQLDLRKTQLRAEMDRLEQAEREANAANIRDDLAIQAIEIRIREREALERQKRDIAEAVRWARVWRELQEQQEAERLARLRKQQQEQQDKQAAAHAEESSRRAQSNVHSSFTNSSTFQASSSACSHAGWWEEVQGRTSCPVCYESWTYLLKCPGCSKKACPKCQKRLRPRFPRRGPDTNRW